MSILGGRPVVSYTHPVKTREENARLGLQFLRVRHPSVPKQSGPVPNSSMQAPNERKSSQSLVAILLTRKLANLGLRQGSIVEIYFIYRSVEGIAAAFRSGPYLHGGLRVIAKGESAFIDECTVDIDSYGCPVECDSQMGPLADLKQLTSSYSAAFAVEPDVPHVSFQLEIPHHNIAVPIAAVSLGNHRLPVIAGSIPLGPQRNRELICRRGRIESAQFDELVAGH